MLEASNNHELAEIPAKRYFPIGEVSELCEVKPHVLRYWEQEFPLLKPIKRRGNRRYYQREDVLIVRQIRSLLYEQGYTIGGARLQIQNQETLPSQTSNETANKTSNNAARIAATDHRQLIDELETILSILRQKTK
ncbi:MAG: transcriptional regulator [Gammaproteobacteria bacterium CG22_combo_CG10-13_8_21_14_all_40_8]|nr:MAG: transcriptional regulator [Gammaproteobacteria bacterium CG22_combo_CG10-13_8_21_14_all_40_8]